MLLDLLLGARPDERFHLQYGMPVPHGWGVDWLCRRVGWTRLFNEHGEDGRFASWIVLWIFRWYRGSVKCDGTRTRAYWAEQLGEPVLPGNYVMTTTPKEMVAFRLSWSRPDRERWDNMGGI